MRVCGLLFCAAKRGGAFPPNISVRPRARVSRLGGFTRLFFGQLFRPQLGPRLFVITGEAITTRPRSYPILMADDTVVYTIGIGNFKKKSLDRSPSDLIY